MMRAGLLCVLLGAWGWGQSPFVPMQMDQNRDILDRNSARQDWVRLTNQRMEMSGRTLRVALEDAGATAVILVKGVARPRHAKPILTGKGDYADLFQAVKALGFTRLVARNPDTGEQWAARLEQGKPILED